MYRTSLVEMTLWRQQKKTPTLDVLDIEIFVGDRKNANPANTQAHKETAFNAP